MTLPCLRQAGGLVGGMLTPAKMKFGITIQIDIGKKLAVQVADGKSLVFGGIENGVLCGGMFFSSPASPLRT